MTVMETSEQLRRGCWRIDARVATER